jgi:hypothetical protein
MKKMEVIKLYTNQISESHSEVLLAIVSGGRITGVQIQEFMGNSLLKSMNLDFGSLNQKLSFVDRELKDMIGNSILAQDDSQRINTCSRILTEVLRDFS